CCLVLGPTIVLATDGSFQSEFETALALQKQSRYAEAIEAYQDLDQRHGSVRPSDLSVVQFNRGLCRLELAKTVEPESRRMALLEVQRARTCFLHAKRLRPDFQRAGQRLDRVAQSILAYEKQIAQEEQADDEFQAKLEALFKRLEQLADAQGQLRDQVPDLSRRPTLNRNRKAAAPPAPEIRLPELEVIEQWPVTQTALRQTGQGIEQELSVLDRRLSMDLPGQPTTESFLRIPLSLMTQAVALQKKAEPYLLKQEQWLLARREMGRAQALMEEILRMMAQSRSSEASEEDGDMEEEDWDDYELSEDDGGQSRDMAGKGDFAQGREMRPLPTPNYSMEEILKEEAENQQFRQENRSKANAAKVKKDW
ncbi:hypothetical protein ACFL6U_16810, partial [Planctomycetota bacterium]